MQTGIARRILANMIRWIKRRKCWSGFKGTSARSCARVKRNGKHWRCELWPPKNKPWLCAVKYWDLAPTWKVAIAWCEYQLRPIETRHTIRALLVFANGDVEQKDVEPRPAYAVRRLPRDVHRLLRIAAEDDTVPDCVPLQDVILTGNRWREYVADPISGHYECVECMVYTENGADPDLVRRAATAELLRQKLALGVGGVPTHRFAKAFAASVGGARP